MNQRSLRFLAVAKHAVTPAQPGMHVGTYLGLLRASEQELADAFTAVGERHPAEAEIRGMCLQLEASSRAHVEALGPMIDQYGVQTTDEAQQIAGALFQGTRVGGIGLLRDLHDLHLLADQVHLCWFALGQAGRGLRNMEMARTCEELGRETDLQISWLRTRMRELAPQALVVPAL